MGRVGMSCGNGDHTGTPWGDGTGSGATPENFAKAGAGIGDGPVRSFFRSIGDGCSPVQRSGSGQGAPSPAAAWPWPREPLEAI